MKRIVAVAVLVLLAAGVAFRLRMVGGQQWPNAVSIKTLPSHQDSELLARARALPVAALYTQPLSQTNPSSCGPTAYANVRRSRGGADTADAVAGTLSGCFFGICMGGVTLDQLASLDAPHATVLRDLTLEQLREELRRSNDERYRYIANFHRGPLFGTGGGHHSPIGGYLEAEDLAYVLDVNAHYGPWLVPAPRLLEALNTVDGANGKSRGLLRLEDPTRR